MKSICSRVAILGVLLGTIAFGQTDAQAPVPQAGPPAPAESKPSAIVNKQIPLPDQYPLRNAIDALKNGDTGSETALPSINAVQAPERRVTTQSNTAARSGEVPAVFEPALSVPLSPTALDGVAISAKMMSERNPPVQAKDGRAMYTFGVGLPTVVCAPLRVCSLELQAGEKILGEPQIGDSVRWEVTPISSGAGEGAMPILVLKPKLSGLDTTMVIATDRRTYYVRLVSEPEEFMARTAFAYSDDEHVQWKIFLAEQAKTKEERENASRVSTLSQNAVDKLFFGYKIEGKGPEEMRPVRVMDDGEKTYIQMPDATLHRELPALVIVVNNVNEMVNYRVKGNTYVVDRLFTKAALTIGTGKGQKTFTITRQRTGVAND